MARHAFLSVALTTLLAASPLTSQAQDVPSPGDPVPAPAPGDPVPPMDPAPADVIPPADAPPADAPPPAELAPVPEPNPAIESPPGLGGLTLPGPLAVPTAAKAELAPLPTRLLMDTVTGVAGGAVILGLGLLVAAPLALLPWILPAAATSFAPMGVPLSLIVTGGLVGAVMAGAVALSAVVQRFLRPLLGPQPSLLGAVLGAVFFGSVGMGMGLVSSFLLVTAMPQPFRGWRDTITGDLSANTPRALAITGLLVVAMAVPLAALGAAIGGPISAEREDSLAVEGAAE